MSDVSESLRSLTKNEQPWAIRSGRSEEMSDVSELLILLTKNEQMRDSLKECLLKKSKILFYYVLFKVLNKKIRKNERIANFRSFPLFWWAMWVNRSFRSNQMSDVSESLRSLTKNERMSESLIFLSKSLIRSFLDKKQAIRSEIKWANSQPCK